MIYGDMHSRISAKGEKREKDCLVTFDPGLSSQGNRLSASYFSPTPSADGKVTNMVTNMVTQKRNQERLAGGTSG